MGSDSRTGKAGDQERRHTQGPGSARSTSGADRSGERGVEPRLAAKREETGGYSHHRVAADPVGSFLLSSECGPECDGSEASAGERPRQTRTVRDRVLERVNPSVNNIHFSYPRGVFEDTLGVHPGLIVGQFKHKTLNHLIMLSIECDKRKRLLDCGGRNKRIEHVQPV